MTHCASRERRELIVLNDRLAVRQAIEELLLIEACSEQAEWVNLVVYLPW